MFFWFELSSTLQQSKFWNCLLKGRETTEEQKKLVEKKSLLDLAKITVCSSSTLKRKHYFEIHSSSASLIYENFIFTAQNYCVWQSFHWRSIFDPISTSDSSFHWIPHLFLKNKNIFESARFGLKSNFPQNQNLVFTQSVQFAFCPEFFIILKKRHETLQRIDQSVKITWIKFS